MGSIPLRLQQPRKLVADPQPRIASALAASQPPTLVTFDVFDTLIWRRTLLPQDVFLSLSHHFPGIASWMRREAERVATFACRRVLRREPTLRDIYCLLPMSQAGEIAAEQRVCVANPHCHSAIQSLSRLGVRIAAISDMYLDAQEIRTLLDACGYPEMPIYSSATESCTKGDNGALFSAIWKRLGVRPSEVFHVGDNAHSDIAMANRLGAGTCHVSTPRATLFDACPSVPRARSAAETLFWGELAIRLHLHLADNRETAASYGNAIQMLVQQRGTISQLSVDEAWREIQYCAEAVGDAEAGTRRAT